MLTQNSTGLLGWYPIARRQDAALWKVREIENVSWLCVPFCMLMDSKEKVASSCKHQCLLALTFSAEV